MRDIGDPEGHPAKQGLKLASDSTRRLDASADPEGHPAKQGLKPVTAQAMPIKIKRSRGTSSKTRIETGGSGGQHAQR